MAVRLPVVAWLCGTTGETVTINVTISAVTEAKVVSIGSVYGWGVTNAGGTAASDTIANALRAAIVSHSAAPTVTAVYDLDAFTIGPATYTLTSSAAVTVNFGTSATAKRFGWSSTSVAFSAATAKTTQYSPTGVWSPNGAGGFVYVETKQRAAASSSDMAAAFTDTLSWGEITIVNLEAVQVPAAFLMGDFAANAIYAAQANRNTLDTNNTLELLLEEAASQVSSRVFRVWRTASATGYKVAKLPDVAKRGRALDYAAWTDKPRYAAVDMTFVGAS